MLMERLLDHVSDLGSEFSKDEVVAVSAGGEVDVIERDAGGKETTVRRQRPADIGVLVVAINRLLEQGAGSLDLKRDRAVFRLTADKLKEAELEYREQRAEQIIRSSLDPQSCHRCTGRRQSRHRYHHSGIHRLGDDSRTVRALWCGAT